MVKAVCNCFQTLRAVSCAAQRWLLRVPFVFDSGPMQFLFLVYCYVCPPLVLKRENSCNCKTHSIFIQRRAFHTIANRATHFGVLLKIRRFEFKPRKRLKRCMRAHSRLSRKAMTMSASYRYPLGGVSVSRKLRPFCNQIFCRGACIFRKHACFDQSWFREAKPRRCIF